MRLEKCPSSCNPFKEGECIIKDIEKHSQTNDETSFSIIIPVKSFDPYFHECILHCLLLDYPNFEILVLPDYPCDSEYHNVKIIATGAVKPSKKRNTGARIAKGDILAFIDSDASPMKDWLKNASLYFKNDDIGAVGGPNLLPYNDNLMQKASDTILSSRLGSGRFSPRYSVEKEHECDELPSCNLLVRKDIMLKIGGFDIGLLTGEDSKLCFQIKENNKKVVYSPDVVIYHHRRPLFMPHLKQIYQYGLDKGRVIREFNGFNRYFYYMPSFFVIGLSGGAVLSLFYDGISKLYFVALGFYFLCASVTGLMTKNIRLAFLVTIGLILTHIAYGIAFMRGLMGSRSKRK